jgi:threonine synthase
VQALAGGLVGTDERVVLFNCATGLKYPLPTLERTLDVHTAIDFSLL